MPVAIACPKCETKYQLPESALGKAVKCKKCGEKFKAARKNTAAKSQPKSVQPGASQASPQEMAKLGIDGPLRRAGDIFAGTTPQQGNQLGNFALEDPGFGNYEIAQQEVEDEKADDGMSSIIDNPFAAPKVSRGPGGGKRKARPQVDVSGYGAAKIGMWIVYLAWGVMVGISGFFCVTYVIGRMVPTSSEWFRETVGPTIAPILAILVTVFFVLWIVAMVSIFVGQIICIFSPNSDEKLFAGLSVGAIVGAAVALFVIFLLIAVAESTGEAGANSEGAAAAIGAIGMVAGLAIWVLTLASLFLFIHYFKKVGQNISSKKVVKAAQLATTTAIVVIVAGFVTSIATGIAMSFVQPGTVEESRSTMLIIMDVLMIINMSLSFTLMGIMMAMVRATLNALRR